MARRGRPQSTMPGAADPSVAPIAKREIARRFEFPSNKVALSEEPSPAHDAREKSSGGHGSHQMDQKNPFPADY